MKDHYKILGVHPRASIREIRKAFALLAKRYHPDKMPDDPLAHARFLELRDAWETLSDAAARAKYDQQKWDELVTDGGDKHCHSAAELITEQRRLMHALTTIDSYRMDHLALQTYILFLLDDVHAELLAAATFNELTEYVNNVLIAIDKLNFSYRKAITDRLGMLVVVPAQKEQVHTRIKTWKCAHLFKQALPFIVLIATLLLCMLMYRYGKRDGHRP